MILPTTYFGIALCLVASVRSQKDMVSQINSMAEQTNIMVDRIARIGENVKVVTDMAKNVANSPGMNTKIDLRGHSSGSIITGGGGPGVYNMDDVPDSLRNAINENLKSVSEKLLQVVQKLQFTEEKDNLLKVAADLNAHQLKPKGRYKRSNSSSKIAVDVFFEGLCPDSKSFIKDYLAPEFPAFENYIDLTLIPFGKAKITSSGIRCQHGPNECKANVVMACALTMLPPGQPQVTFTDCFMTNPTEYGRLQTCANGSNLDAAAIESCAEGKAGYNLQLENERLTLMYTPGPKFVPTVIINKKYDDMIQQMIQHGAFAAVLCQILQDVPPCVLAK